MIFRIFGGTVQSHSVETKWSVKVFDQIGRCMLNEAFSEKFANTAFQDFHRMYSEQEIVSRGMKWGIEFWEGVVQGHNK